MVVLKKAKAWDTWRAVITWLCNLYRATPVNISVFWLCKIRKRRQICLIRSSPKSEKAFSFSGLCPLTLHQELYPWIPLGALPSDPCIGSCMVCSPCVQSVALSTENSWCCRCHRLMCYCEMLRLTIAMWIWMLITKQGSDGRAPSGIQRQATAIEIRTLAFLGQPLAEFKLC